MKTPAKIWLYTKSNAEDSWRAVTETADYHNPSEFTLEKGAQVPEITIPGLDTPLLQYVRGQTERLSLDLFFDTTDEGMGDDAVSVTTQTDEIYRLVKKEPDTHAPPICLVVWGPEFPGGRVDPEAGEQRRYGFQCLVENIRQRFTLFSTRGVPLRATLTLQLREYRPLEEQLGEQNPSSPDRTHGHVLQRGETLSRLSGRYYRRPGAWRAIAEGNELDDPRRVTPGTFLTIPPIR